MEPEIVLSVWESDWLQRVSFPRQKFIAQHAMELVFVQDVKVVER
jgi:hypothetical protein